MTYSEVGNSLNDATLKIAVLGFGAVGTALGWRLTQGGIAFAAFGRQGRSHQVHHLQVGRTVNRVCGEARSDHFDLLFVTVRAPDLATLMPQVQSILSPTGIVIVLCNGAVESTVREFSIQHPHFQFRVGCVEFGVSQESQDRFQLFGESGPVTWGPLQNDIPHQMRPSPSELAVLSAVPIFKYDEDALWICRRKWLVNTVVNTLCGAYDIAPNRGLLLRQAELEQLFEESFQLGQKTWGDWPFSKNDLLKHILKIVIETGNNTNSMVRDLRSGRKTELDFLSGLSRDSMDCPLMTSLNDKIRRREQAAAPSI